MKKSVLVTMLVVAAVSLSACASEPKAQSTHQSSEAEAESSAITPEAEVPSPDVVPVSELKMPDVSKSMYDDHDLLESDNVQATFIDETGSDVTEQFDPESYMYKMSPYVFVSQSVPVGKVLTEPTSVTIKVAHPPTVLTVDFSGAGGTVTSIDGSSLSQSTNLPQHWTKSLPYENDVDFTLTNPYADGPITCTITVGGTESISHTASGPLATVTC